MLRVNSTPGVARGQSCISFATLSTTAPWRTRQAGRDTLRGIPVRASAAIRSNTEDLALLRRQAGIPAGADRVVVRRLPHRDKIVCREPAIAARVVS